MKLFVLILIFAIFGVNAQDAGAALDDGSETVAEYIPSLVYTAGFGAELISMLGNLTGGDASVMRVDG